MASMSSVEFRSGVDRAYWRSAESFVSLDRVQRVWFRRHRLPQLPSDMERAHADYCLRESQWFVRGILLSLANRLSPDSWMSDPFDVQRAESKTLQLSVAKSLGLACPDTLISNDPDAIREFFDQQDCNVVAKPLRMGYFDYGELQTAAYTTVLSSADLADAEALLAAPVIYQRHLPKRCDVRVTVVDGTIYSAAIHSQKVASAKVDWRRADVELEHTVHPLPKDLADASLRLMSALRLKFGAIDFVLTPEGDYYFLEINPSGQWLWLEDKLGFPITDRIASWLGKIP